MPLIFGTWKLDPYYGKLKTWLEAESLIEYSIEKNILSFDTAIVYGNGRIEEILGNYSHISDLNIITKIPSQIKNKNLNANLDELYPKEWIERNIIESCDRLKRNNHIVLLHNYNNWNGIEGVINNLLSYKKKGYMKKIGISIPNNFQESINRDVVKNIDFIEVPYNINDLWIEKNITNVCTKEIALRSMVDGNKSLGVSENTFFKATKFSENLIVGMTKEKQVNENMKIIKKLGV